MTQHSAQLLWVSRRRLLTLCMLATSGTGLANGQSAPACVDPLQLEALASELRSLRTELLQEKIERAQARITDLEQQLQRAEVERNQASSYERSQAQELAELHELLSQPAIHREERADLEAYRTQLINSGAALGAERTAAAAKREGELREQLEGARRLRSHLVETLRSLGGTPRRS